MKSIVDRFQMQGRRLWSGRFKQEDMKSGKHEFLLFSFLHDFLFKKFPETKRRDTCRAF